MQSRNKKLFIITMNNIASVRTMMPSKDLSIFTDPTPETYLEKRTVSSENLLNLFESIFENLSALGLLRKPLP